MFSTLVHVCCADSVIASASANHEVDACTLILSRRQQRQSSEAHCCMYDDKVQQHPFLTEVPKPMAISKLSVCFWSIATADALLFLVLFVSLKAQSSGSDSGGRAMGLLFFVLLPCIVLGLTMLLFRFCPWAPVRWTALMIVAGPGLYIAVMQMRGVYLDYSVQQAELGRGYFSGSAMKAMAEAVVRLDVPNMRRIAPRVDINGSGEYGTTLISLAVERAYDSASGATEHAQLPVVLALLEFGAKPDSGLEWALRLRDSEILEALLRAGANPNLLNASEQPVVFGWLSVMRLQNFQLMIVHGLNVDATNYDAPMAFEAAIHERWDLLSLLIDHGADVRRPRPDGRNVPDELAQKIAEALAEGKVPDPQMLDLQARIKELR
jgi:hypothetical protein